ncbi:MAG: 2TM domain-containing protein [Phaeodactylibacter sp.]|nr:2TM domain-containing protein [Phaeodactylibacter sp.]
MEYDNYEKAKKIVKKKKKFYHHLKSYVIVNGIFMVFMFLEGELWDWMPVALFWGMGLLFHYVNTFGLPGSNVLSKEWEDEEIEREYHRLSGGSSPKRSKRREDDTLELKDIQRSYRESDLV